MKFALDIADAVAAHLLAAADGTFTSSFTPERGVLPYYRLDGDFVDKPMRVTITPGDIEVSSASRGINEYEVQVNLAIQKHTPGDDDGAAGVTVTLEAAQEITDYLFGKMLLADTLRAQWRAPSVATLYDADHLAETNISTTMITQPYRVYR